MIIIFDLDDTLYNERMYVEGGLRSVASFGAEQFGWDREVSFNFMIDILDREGRGSIFDKWLAINGRYSKTLVGECVRIYRHHSPQLQLCPEAVELLPLLSKYPLYLVTDGHKIVQKKKIQSLNLSPFFRYMFITHCYGIRHAKPSTYCFAKIREREKCQWHQMVYIGDNPAKDFVNLKPLGVHTVRVLTGVHRKTQAQPDYEAHQIIENLGYFYPLLKNLEQCHKMPSK
jgi:putative hydrolase of the HAD superfamily